MADYRMCVDATVCFTVQAGTEAEAMAKAKAAMEAYCDGIDLELVDAPCQEMRIYLDEASEVEIHDIQNQNQEEKKVEEAETRSEAANKQSYDDLAASGGIVDAP